ncbi:MAG TPA: carbohydrate-binding protein [Puia sp.]|nr:carbohydrate-binding protein [Puia sp.]
MKKLLLFLFFPVFCYGQGDQTIINVPINATGTTFQAILHLPNDYGATTTAYPLLIFLHGLGEGGPNPASIYTSSTAGGPAYFIAQGVFPASFVNPKDGKSYKYIVVSPQANPQGVEGSTTAQELDFVLTYLYAHYRVDTSRVYLTGLSDGGETVVEYVGGEMTNNDNFAMFHRTHSIAAIVPMSENASAGLLQEEADSIVSENLGAWGFGSTDVQGLNTLQLSQYCNRIKPGTMIFTSYSGGHCCWGQFYDPSFTQNGMSIYQWMLQFTHGAGALAVTTPVANAGAARTVQLPTSQTTLSGSASTVTNGTIASYSWAQQSGPSTADIDSPKAESTVVTGLSAGVYVFSLTITDNTGKTSSATVQVTVDAAVQTGATGLVIPGKIEAASYEASIGVMTQNTSDTGGGLNVGWIDVGDWMDYKVNVATAGSYTVSFRVATPNTGASFQLRTPTGTVLATIQVPNTGGWQDWVTVSATASLATGSQTLQLYSTSVAGWNINWMNFAAGTQGAQSVTGPAFATDSALVASSSTGVGVTNGVILYPNPAKSDFTIQVGNALSGTMIIQMFDATGRIRQVQALQKDQPAVQVEMAADALPSGTYFVRVQIGNWSEIKKLMKY